jgi:ring-1,2-phenylacetyl-CoA epoxidase subunit PaaD
MNTLAEIWQWLDEIKDPEIPVLSLVDLGVITEVSQSETGKVSVQMTPTFAGCPAMDYMKKAVEETLHKNGIADFTVSLTFDNPWNSNKITEKGKQALKQFGLAPPPTYNLILDLEILEQAVCPHCNSTDTTIRSPFGPTLCRSMHFCHQCRQMFEQFKPI